MIKTKGRYNDMTEFDVLLKTAQAQLSEVDASSAPYLQVICAQSAGGTIYRALFRNALSAEAEMDRFFEMLRTADDTTLSLLVCVWANGAVDVPSYAFRKALLALDATNADCRIFLKGEHGYNERTVVESF